jgi:hypothetical protein
VAASLLVIPATTCIRRTRFALPSIQARPASGPELN